MADVNEVRSMDIYGKLPILVGVYLPGPTPLKNMKVSWDDEIPNIWKIKKCSKPPTRPIYLGSRWHLWAESKPTEA